MAELLAGDPDPAVLALVELGLHHEQQHQELALMDIKHVLSRNVLDPVYRPAPDDPADEVGDDAVRWVEHGGGLVEIGHDGEGFAFDNEGPRHAVHLAPFAVASRLVTEGEVAGLHRRRRVPAPGAVAERRLGHGAGRGMGGPALLAGATRPGRGRCSPSPGGARCGPASRCAT